MRHLLRLCCLLLAGAASLDAAALPGGHVKARLAAATSSIQPGVPLEVALRLEMDKGWHTYWTNPGAAGAPTSASWKLPPGFSAGELQFPFPEHIVSRGASLSEFALAGPGVSSYGYHGEVVLLSRIEVPADAPVGSTVTISCEARWFVCSSQMCVPGQAKLELTLPVQAGPPATNEANRELFARARSHLPADPAGKWRLQARIDAGRLLIGGTPAEGAQAPPAGLRYFPAKKGLIDDEAEQKLTTAGSEFVLDVPLAQGSLAKPDRIRGVLVATDPWPGLEGRRAVLLDVGPDAPPPLASVTAPPPAAGGTLLMALWFSFLGGLLLNLMPCVLPVLSLKVLGFVEQAHDEQRAPWRHGAVFSAGVVLSFLVLGAALLALRAGGEQLGWGFQLQYPPFVALLVILFFLFGLNLLGVFEVGLGLTSIDAGAQRSGLTSSFLNGVLATVIATPCTAPFMGSALGVAITQPAVAALAIFGLMGLGLATPYLVLSLFPRLLRYVPRPGAWMESFKQGLGFMLMAAVIWLLWVFGGQTGSDGVILLLAGLLLVGIGGWVLGRWATPSRSTKGRRLARALATAFAAGGVAVGVGPASRALAPTASSAAHGKIEWVEFSPAKLAALAADGKTVFLDFTARWCVTCKVNEKIAFTEAVARDLKARGIVPMQADWTTRNEEITTAMAAYGRNGVPLYVLLRPGKEPEILPQLLTPDILLAAFAEAPPGPRQNATPLGRIEE